MNIFMLDDDPKKCAQYHCDEHVRRALMEYPLMLATAHIDQHGECAIKENDGRSMFILESIFTHPCSRWARANLANYIWLLDLSVALLEQYRLRFKNTPVNADKLLAQLHTPPKQLLKFQTRTDVPLIMPVEFHRRNPVEAYRLYCVARKGLLGKWTYPAHTPHWWESMKADRVAAGGALI